MLSMAVIATTHNRVDLSIRAFESLLNDRYKFDVYVCDDSSDDGTPERLREVILDIHLIHGNGRLYW